jgi:hypothetical protein
MSDDFTPTITAPNVQPGMVLQFAGTTLVETEDHSIPIWEAEVNSVERPNGDGDWGFWITPEDSEVALFVWVEPDRHFPIVG